MRARTKRGGEQRSNLVCCLISAEAATQVVFLVVEPLHLRLTRVKDGLEHDRGFGMPEDRRAATSFSVRCAFDGPSSY